MRLAAIITAFALAAAPVAGPVAAEEKMRFEIGYAPDFSVAQLFVGIESGLFEEAEIAPDLVEFPSAEDMIEALLAGRLDTAYLSIEAAAAARAQGADIKIVAACDVEPVRLVALGELAGAIGAGDLASGFWRFAEAHGRKPVIATQPAGSVAETALSRWLAEGVGVDPDAVEIHYHGAAQLRQALLSGEVDGAVASEPTVAMALAVDPGARIVARGDALFPNQPGAVLAVRESVIAQNEGGVQALVAAHARATAQLISEPAGAAAQVQPHIEDGRLDLAIVESAIANAAGSWSADPNRIFPGAEALQEYRQATGAQEISVKLDHLFETRFFDALEK